MDTTGESGSAALVENGRIVEEISLESADGFAHILFGEIERLLARHGCGVRDIDLFATAAGPGSFTGVRVGIAAAKGLAEAAGRPAAAVSNLQALAWFGSRPLRAVAIDARRGEIYGAVYNQALEPVCAEVVMKLEAWLATVPAGEVEFIGAGFPLAPRALAGAIGMIAASRPELTRDPAEIDANYVRRSDAELLWKE